MTDTVLGLLRTDGLDLALPLEALREVVPCPDVLTDVPVAATGLLGVMTLRATVVPVVDLVHLLGREHGRRRGQVVVVVAHGGELVGLLVDEVRGLATVAPSTFAEVSAAGDGLLFRRTFPHPEQGHVVCLLDEARLFRLPGVPVVREPARQAAAAATVTDTGATRALTVVRCGAFSLALDVAHVHATVPAPALRPSPADGPVCLGTTPVAGSDVGVVDLLALLGLGALAGTPLECGLVLDLPAGQVVLGVSDMVGLHDVPASRVVPLPPSASPSPLLRSVADVPGVGACLLVDGAGLKDTDTLVTLSRITTASEQASPGAGTAAGRAPATGPAHLAYRAGVELATDLVQVAEVLAYPDDLVPSSGAPGVLGFVVHRGVAVPVTCLATVLGRTPAPYTATSRLLLLDVDGEPVAYAVEALHAILPLVWTDPASGRPGSPDPLRAGPLVQLDTTASLVPALDLVALTRVQRGTPEVPAPREPGDAMAVRGRAGV